MVVKLVKFPLLLVFLLTGSLFVYAQSDASTPSGRPRVNEDLPVGIKETLAKGRIQREEKDYQELVERGEEAAKLVEQLGKSLESNQAFSAEDKKKLDRLEKLIKRIRSDLGGEDDEQVAKEKIQAKNLSGIIKIIQEDTANLLSEIKRIGRHTISVIAIKSSNSVLKLVRFLRFNTN